MAEAGERETFDRSRREFLRWAAIAGVSIAAAGSVPFALAGAPAPPEGDPQRRHKWTMLIDLRRCDGCKKCELACRKEHNVPEGQNWLKVFTLTAASGTFFMAWPPSISRSALHAFRKPAGRTPPPIRYARATTSSCPR